MQQDCKTVWSHWRADSTRTDSLAELKGAASGQKWKSRGGKREKEGIMKLFNKSCLTQLA